MRRAHSGSSRGAGSLRSILRRSQGDLAGWSLRDRRAPRASSCKGRAPWALRARIWRTLRQASAPRVAYIPQTPSGQVAKAHPENRSQRFSARHLPAAIVCVLLLAAGLAGVESARSGASGVEAPGPASGAEPVRSQSYVGHDQERDTQVLVSAYPHLAGTRLDDCQTCHRGGEVLILDRGERQTRHFDHCAFCHLLMPESEVAVVAGGPESPQHTLNPFGADYAGAGRSGAALETIAAKDSDGDSHANALEIAALRYPGDPQSRPGQPVIPVRRLEWGEVTALPRHEQLLLLNAHKQREDAYAFYGGVKVLDLLAAAGADLTRATSVSFIAPDGYTTDFDIETLRRAFPRGLYFAGLDRGEGAFVTYPPAELLPAGLVDGGEIPGEPAIILAYRNEGKELDRGRLDPASGRLEGEGPYRLIVPQGLAGGPGAPDRGSAHSPSGLEDGLDYDARKDHNAGYCVRGVVALRVNPLPEGYEEFDWKNGGYALLENRQLIVYGAGIGTDEPPIDAGGLRDEPEAPGAK